MKQYITPKQLNELSERGKERLRKWWKPKAGDRYLGGVDVACYKADFSVVETDTCWRTKEQYKKYLRDLKGNLPLLSIGQMIEFLNGKEFEGFKFNCILKEDGWAVGTYHEGSGWGDGDWVGSWVYKNGNHIKKLCDALFEATKEVLEK